MDPQIKALALFGFAVILAVAFYGITYVIGWVIADSWYTSNPTPEDHSKSDDYLKKELYSKILRLRIMVGVLLWASAFLISYIILFVEGN